MDQKVSTIIANISLNIAYLLIAFVVVWALSPLHELFHYLPCKLAGLNPTISYFSGTCNGIGEKSHFAQFFYFMGPYLFFAVLLVVLYYLAKKYFWVKYLIPLPAIDILYNYVSSGRGSDFSFMLYNTYPDLLPFAMSMILIFFIGWFTVKAIGRFRIWSFGFILDRQKGLGR